MKRTADDVVESLRREIDEARYRPEERLPAERSLSASLGVARGTLREALKRLERDGYIEKRAGSGTYVRALPDAVAEITRPLELVEARFALEPHACRLVVLHATDRELDDVEALVDQMEQAVDSPERFAAVDASFHDLIATLTRNPVLVHMAETVAQVRNQPQWARMRTITLNQRVIRAYNVEHRAILDAIRARDPEAAAERMKAHLAAARASLLTAMQA